MGGGCHEGNSREGNVGSVDLCFPGRGVWWDHAHPTENQEQAKMGALPVVPSLPCVPRDAPTSLNIPGVCRWQ